MFAYIYILYFIGRDYALDNSFVFEFSPANSTLDLRCLIENLEFARSVKYQNHPSKCEKLSKDWNENPTYSTDFVYSKMKWYESPFEKKKIKTLTFPDSFEVDCGLDVVFETSDVIQNGFIVNIKDADSSILYIHLSVRPKENEAVLNTVVNGIWLDEIIAPLNGFANSTNTYTTTFFLRSTHWEVYADGVFLNNFTHVYTFNGTAAVKCQSTDTFCKRVIFYGP